MGRRGIGCALGILCAAAAIDARGAELQVRESVLRQQADRVTAEFRAQTSHVGRRAHPLGEDCDLHVPLRSGAIRVPLIGEVKNACSRPAEAPATHWADEIEAQVGDQLTTAIGVFRIWLEHPPPRGGIQSEARRLPPYRSSNPDHMVELHPLLALGSLDFRSHVTWIEKNDDWYEGYGYDKLRLLVSRRLEIAPLTVNGNRLVRLVANKMGYNHWSLRGVIRAPIERLSDGARSRLDVIDGTGRRAPLADHAIVAAARTPAFNRFTSLRPGDSIDFLALGRIEIRSVLASLAAGRSDIRLPVEFVLLDFEAES